MSNLFNRRLSKAKISRKAEEFDLIDEDESVVEDELNVVSLDEDSVTEIVEQLVEEIQEAVEEVVEDVKEAAIKHNLTQAQVLHVLKRMNQAGIQVEHPRLAKELKKLTRGEDADVRKIAIAAIDTVEEILRRAAVFVASGTKSKTRQARIASSLDRELVRRKVAKTAIASPKEVRTEKVEKIERTARMKRQSSLTRKPKTWLNLK